jgi:ABC-type dipeptide/oligopeptide/nickel transport system ATPase component
MPGDALLVRRSMAFGPSVSKVEANEVAAFLMMTHDILVARAFADRVAVMHRGLIVESGPADVVLERPRHDYTRRLIESVPRLDRCMLS